VWSSDVFLYDLHARVATVHGLNPYVTTGSQIPGLCVEPGAGLSAAGAGGPCGPDRACAPGLACAPDPYLNLHVWAGEPAAYGPLALGLAILAYDPGAGVLDNALRLRVIECLLLLLAGVLLMRAGGPRAGALLLWHPLAFLEVGNSGHTEGAIVLGVAALAVILRRRPAPAPVGAVAGLVALVKLPLLALAAPLALAWPKGARLRPWAWLAAAAALVVGAGTALAWASPHPFAGLLAVGRTVIGSPTLVASALLDALGVPWALPVVRGVAAAGILAWLVRRARVAHGPGDAFALAGATWLLATVALSGLFHPWHALVPLAFAAVVAPGRPFVRAALALSVLAPVCKYGGWLLSQRFDTFTTVAIPLATFAPLLLFVPWPGLSRASAPGPGSPWGEEGPPGR
jgi:hypothetical protein